MVDDMELLARQKATEGLLYDKNKKGGNEKSRF
jgi:hypothetical protein